MPYSITFEVHTMPLTLNEVMGKHWRARHTNFEKVKSEIGARLTGLKPKTPLKSISVKILRMSSGTLDPDNLYFTCKPVLDALVREGVMIDDGFENIKKLSPTQVKIKRGMPKKLIVSVEEV